MISRCQSRAFRNRHSWHTILTTRNCCISLSATVRFNLIKGARVSRESVAWISRNAFILYFPEAKISVYPLTLPLALILVAATAAGWISYLITSANFSQNFQISKSSAIAVSGLRAPNACRSLGRPPSLNCSRGSVAHWDELRRHTRDEWQSIPRF